MTRLHLPADWRLQLSPAEEVDAAIGAMTFGEKREARMEWRLSHSAKPFRTWLAEKVDAELDREFARGPHDDRYADEVQP